MFWVGLSPHFLYLSALGLWTGPQGNRNKPSGFYRHHRAFPTAQQMLTSFQEDGKIEVKPVSGRPEQGYLDSEHITALVLKS